MWFIYLEMAVSLVNRGGKYNNLQPASSISCSIRPPLWKVALSITTTCPTSSTGSKQVSSQVSNTVRLHAPSTVKGAIKFLLHNAFRIAYISRFAQR